jgi:xanthine dehydrogenase D subunit
MTTDVRTDREVQGGIGESILRPDGIPKLTGNFAYASDLYDDRMLWGATVRSPHAHARITRLDVAPALALAGVQAVLTQDEVPGRAMYGLEHVDQPVLADDMVRYWGQPVAVVAADDAETARTAAAAVVVEYEVLEPLTDPEEALDRDEVFRHLRIRRGDPESHGEIVVEGYYEIGSQDQAPLGTEAGLAIPDGQGGVDLYAVSQWLHADHEQIFASLGLDPDQVRCHPTGIGGAFGAREDMSIHIHACLLALRTGRPVKMVYDRAESFVGHVHRHPARMWYRHEADRSGRLVRVEAKIILDGGAFASTTSAVTANAAYFAVGPYNVDTAIVDGYGVRTNNPPNGAMRGFGAVQSCFGYESQMDKLAAAVGLGPLEIRRRNALAAGDPMPTSGQTIEGSLPTREVIDALETIPLPTTGPRDDPVHLPGGTGLTTPVGAVRRGIGYALGIKNFAFSEAFDDFADARVVVTPAGVEVHTSAVEVGQGLVTVMQQIARSALGIGQVAVVFDDTSQIGSAGSTSASRQTQVTGRAVLDAAAEVRTIILERHGGDDLDDRGVWREGELIASLEEVCAAGPVEHRTRFRHPPTYPTDENGQGSPHAGFGVAIHRAVVDVDPELGLVRVIKVDTAQDVGKALNPQSVVGQIEGGTLQGIGLGIMEELVVDEGKILNASFTDYLLPTFLDAPDIETRLVEEPDHWGPYGAKGVGEPPTISSVPAVVAAIRDATGRDLNRAPVRPQDIVGV